MPKSPRFEPNRSPKRFASSKCSPIPSVQLLDVTGPFQVFVSANDHVAQAGGTPPYVLRVVAKDGGRNGFGRTWDRNRPLPRTRNASGHTDGRRRSGRRRGCRRYGDGRLGAAATKRARRVASVCTGAFLLGASGAARWTAGGTHWSYCAELARRFPAVRVESDPIFVRDGPVWTSAGVTAGIDLALALVEEDLGRTVALAVARYLVVFLKRPGGQAQFSAALSLQAADDEFGALHEWINRHLADDLSLPVLADQAGMSERSFSRHYAEATGITPARAIERLRVEAARRLLIGVTPAGEADRRSVAASVRRKQCAVALAACSPPLRKTIALGSALRCRLFADFVAEVRCRLFWSVIPSL